MSDVTMQMPDWAAGVTLVLAVTSVERKRSSDTEILARMKDGCPQLTKGVDDATHAPTGSTLLSSGSGNAVSKRVSATTADTEHCTSGTSEERTHA